MYAKIESQKSGISVNEFASSVEASLEDNQGWLVREFISDQVYMSNLIKVGSEMQTKAKDGQITEKEVEKIMKKIETDYPVCWIILPVLLSLAKMRSSLWTLTPIVFFCSCSELNKSNSPVEQIVISIRDSLIKARNDSLIGAGLSRSAPPRSYYTGLNFLFDETSNIYFHDTWIKCWHEEYEQKPPFMNLKEADVVVLSYADIKAFVDSIYQSYDPSQWKVIQIASTSDTINMKSYEVLNSQIDKERKFAKAPLRLITKEEMAVLKKIKAG